jgi:hypothetical protein
LTDIEASLAQASVTGVVYVDQVTADAEKTIARLNVVPSIWYA